MSDSTRVFCGRPGSGLESAVTLEQFDDGWIQRQSVATLRYQLGKLDLPWHDDRASGVHRLAAMQDGSEVVHALGQPLRRTKTLAIDEYEEVAQVLGFVRRIHPGFDVSQIGGVGQKAREQVHHERKAVPLVTADWQQEPVQRHLWIGRRAPHR